MTLRLLSHIIANYLVDIYIRLLSHIVSLMFIENDTLHTAPPCLALLCHTLSLQKMLKIQTKIFRVMEKYRMFIISQKFCS